MKNIQEKGVYVFFSLVLIAGFLLLGEGITGTFSVDWEETYCSDQIQCQSPEVCCKFYNEEGGVCATSDRCASIASVTKYEKAIKTTEGPLTKEEVESLIKTEKPERLLDEFPTIIISLILIGLGIFYQNREKALKAGKRKLNKNASKGVARKRKSTKRSRTKR